MIGLMECQSQSERSGHKEKEKDDMRPRSITDEQIAEARRLRATGMPYLAIAKTLGTSDNGIRRYCEDVLINQMPPMPLSCPDCGQALPKEARFCYMCGTKILTEREKIVRDLEHLRNIVMFIPETRRDSTLQTINGAVKYLKNLED